MWRILIGLSLIPAFGTLYQRLTLPESTRFNEARKNAARIQDEEAIEELKKKANADPGVNEKDVTQRVEPVTSENSSADGTQTPSESPESQPAQGHAKELADAKKDHFKEFIAYFSEWRHAKILIGTCMCWFLLDIAYVYLVPPLLLGGLTRRDCAGSMAST